MRREGFEMSVSQPQVIFKTIENIKSEPIEILHVNVPEEYSGKIIELVGIRRGELIDMESNGIRKNLKFHLLLHQ